MTPVVPGSTAALDAPGWLDPRWRASALDWVTARLGELGRSVQGEVGQPHVYPWSTVLRVPTAEGVVWFKANARGTAYEVPLLTALGGWCPDRVLVPLAADAERGWVLLPDGGTTLRAAQAGHTDVAHWERVLVEYAELQRLLVPHAEEMVALGVPDLRPAALPGHLADLLADEPVLMVDEPDGITSADLARLRSEQGRFARWCDELAATGIPSSLQHDDLHDANIFVPSDGAGPYRVFDWGDASVAHPFTTLLVTLRVVAQVGKLPNGAPELFRLRDAYLEAWTGEHDRATLLEACRLALLTGPLGRALSYRRSLLDATPSARARHGDGVPGWLVDLGAPGSLDAETDADRDPDSRAGS
jgi:hypothetical protein